MRDHQVAEDLLLLLGLVDWSGLFSWFGLTFLLNCFRLCLLPLNGLSPILQILSLRHLAHSDSSVVLMDAIISKTQVHRHSSIALGPFLHFHKALPDIRKGTLELALQIASNDHPYVVLLDDVEDVVLLVDLGELLELVAGEVHEKFDLVFGAFVVLDGEGVEGGVLHSEMQAVEQAALEGQSPFFVP